MADRKSFFDALWGPGGHFIAETEEGGRKSNLDYRKKRAEKRVRDWLKDVEKDHASRELYASGPAPSVRDYREGERSMPTDAPTIGGFQDGTLPTNPYANALGAAGEIRGPDAYTADMPMHANTMRDIAEAAHPYLGPLTSPLLEGAGYANEAIDAVRGILKGGQQSGFDQTDLVANRLGIMEGIRKARNR